MWDTVQTNRSHLSHDLPCPGCGHAAHTYLPCSDLCRCCRRNPLATTRRLSGPAAGGVGTP